MLLKNVVDTYLNQKYSDIEAIRQHPNFEWSSIKNKIESDTGSILDCSPDYIRGRFRYIRKSQKKWLTVAQSLITQELMKEQQSILDSSSGVIEVKTVATIKPIKRLIFDIETSPNIVFSWSIGSKCYLGMENIIQERSIICIAYKWEGEDKVYSLTWNKGDDKDMLEEFAKIINSADVVVTHNGDNFDIRWVRARCMFHGIKMVPKLNSIDTLKLARAQFRLNSNKLTYISQFLGLGAKIDTGGFGLWKEICLNNDLSALDKMVKYCENDVILLEKVYQALREYSPVRKFKLVV